MFYLRSVFGFFFFCAICGVFGQASLFGISPYSTLYSINPATRGADIIKMFQALSQAPYFTPNSEIGFVTFSNGFIPFVQHVEQSPFNTLLVITYRTTKAGTAAQNLYVVVPVEEISEMIYSNATITSTNFSSTIPSDVIPYYGINLGERAADIQRVVYALRFLAPYKTGSQEVTLQTTLSGPYYAPIVNGVIPDVQGISFPSGSDRTLMLVTYQIDNINKYIIVSPEQVTAVNYYPKGLVQ